MSDLAELKRQGFSIQAISATTGFDRKTVRKYLRDFGGSPEHGPRATSPSKLDPFKPYLEERLAGVWNAVVMLGELRTRHNKEGYNLLKD